jgi:predicted O-linked N-acetylglucosamine transferase (SPINDLY family)
MSRVKPKKNPGNRPGHQKAGRGAGWKTNAPASSIQEALRLAMQQHQAGRLEQAREGYRQILARDPDNAVASHFLGVIASQTGESDLAVELISRAVAVAPHYAQAHNNLGVVYYDLQQYDKAIACYDRALALNPAYAEALYNLGNARMQQGRLPEAQACYRQALAVNPEHVDALNNLAHLLNEQHAFAEALAVCRQAVRLNAGLPVAHYNLGNALQGLRQYDEAGQSYRQALAVQPDYADALHNLGMVQQKQGRLEEAAATYQKAISLKPDFAASYNNLGNVYKQMGEFAAAIINYRKAMEAAPAEAAFHSNLLLALNYSQDYAQQDIYEASVAWNARHAHGLPAGDETFSNPRDRERKLRIGYLSPDFRSHSVAYFFEPLLDGHNREEMEVFCYADVPVPDRVTRRLAAKAQHWIDIAGKNDAAVAEMIRADRIDILVDLAGHTAGNRLPVFALKPAPIQVSWLGYPNTTGLAAMDYRLTDGIADPAGEADRLHSEELVRLPHGFLCYRPEETAPRVAESPAARQGCITFGCFNNLSKINAEVIAAWSALLRAVPGARLFLKSEQLTDPGMRAKVTGIFAQHGIGRDRIDVCPWQPSIRDHLALYNNVDIGLDPFPYNGTTTTFEALWMGVPVIALRGDRHAGRVGASILTHIGCPELIAESAGEYVEKAVLLAGDTARLAGYRAALRRALQSSPLTGAHDFAREMEARYRGMWRRWCDR